MTRSGGRPLLAARLAAAMLLAVGLLAPAAPALAWGGGATSYGTHDWIVDQAAKVLDGRAADWFDVATALASSDDPDSVENHDPLLNEHTYRDRGRRGGGPARIAYEYDVAQADYRAGVAARNAGDDAAASRAFEDASYHIGLLAHILGDLSQPFHTAYAAIDKNAMHHDYEVLVTAQQKSRSATPQWQSSRRTVSRISDILKTSIATAAYSRKYYSELHDIFSHGGVRMTSRVSEITGNVLRRVTNDLADVIWSISQGGGAQPAVGSISMSVRWTGVRAGDENAVYVHAYDVNGRPIEGLRIDLAWPTPTGIHMEYLYPDGSGYQQRIYGVGKTPKLVLRSAVATATVRGVTTTATRAWTISPRLATGSAGFRTSVSDSTVVAGQTVTVTSIARDANGHGVPNLLVTWTWDFDGARVRTKGYTDANGRATSARPITGATPHGRVTVTARTQAGSANRSSDTAFHRVD